MVKWCSYESPHYQTLNKCQFYMLDKIFMIRSAFEILIKGKQKGCLSKQEETCTLEFMIYLKTDI